MENDTLGDKCKFYEQLSAGAMLIPTLPVCMRIDGREFSKFTKGLSKPYHEGLSNLMVATVKYLVEETNAVVGYTQSDEISLVWHYPAYESEMMFGGKIQKITSVFASLATVFFNKNMKKYLPESHWDKMPVFDARVWNVPTLKEASNVMLWRQLDAIKNSISMLAQAHYSHHELQHKNTTEMKKLLLEDMHVDWNTYPEFFKSGTFVKSQQHIHTLSDEEIEALPPKHSLRFSESKVYIRNEVALIKFDNLLMDISIEGRVKILFSKV